jgi:hypothetical protein
MQKVLWAAVVAIGVAVGNVSAEEKVIGAAGQRDDLAVAVVEAAITSLRDHPNQMTVRVNAVGAQASNTGGIGYNISPHISGGGGSFTGIEVKGVGNVQVLQDAGNEAATRQSAETVALLEQIRDALQKRENGKARSLLDPLGEKALNVVYEVVKAAVLSRLGLPSK